MELYIVLSLSIRTAFSAASSVSPRVNNIPDLPSSMTSGKPPTRLAATGTLQAIASRAASPKDSCWLGSSIRWEEAI